MKSFRLFYEESPRKVKDVAKDGDATIVTKKKGASKKKKGTTPTGVPDPSKDSKLGPDKHLETI